MTGAGSPGARTRLSSKPSPPAGGGGDAIVSKSVFSLAAAPGVDGGCSAVGDSTNVETELSLDLLRWSLDLTEPKSEPLSGWVAGPPGSATVGRWVDMAEEVAALG